MNAPSPPIELALAHRWFSADCFNRTWQRIEQTDRTAEEAEQMLLTCQASLWHWTQRSDCTSRNLSIGYWQLSRVCSVLGLSSEALRAAENCLRHSQGEAPFFLGFAHEALARAYAVSGDLDACRSHRAVALAFAAELEDPEERGMLEKDLAELG